MDSAESARWNGPAPVPPLGRLLAPRLFFLDIVVDGYLLQIVSLEDLVTIQTTHIIDPIPAHQEFCARMFTTRHRKPNIPILMMAVTLSSPVSQAIAPPALQPGLDRVVSFAVGRTRRPRPIPNFRPDLDCL